MFNLIVKGSEWANETDGFPLARIFEYTAPQLAERFKPAGQPDFATLSTLPTLFLQESYREGDQVAHVGTILRAYTSSGDVRLEYVYERNIPPILNRQLQAIAGELGIGVSEFTRTHWAVKEADLFRALLRNLQPRRNRPTVFQLANPESIQRTLVSAMMPFHPSFTPVYEALKRTAESAGMHCRRADDIWENPAVIQDVVSLIDRSRIVICDCSTRNPNVFYEIGIAHTLGREVILITQSSEDIPFDLRHLRYEIGRASCRERV